MKKLATLSIFIAFCLISLNKASWAQEMRVANFDLRDSCLEQGGVWRKFGNGCVDSCRAKFDKLSFCSMAITYGCDCGDDSCYYNGKCVALTDYQKLHDELQAKISKDLEDSKKERELEFKAKKNEIIKGLIKRYNIAAQAPPPGDSDSQQLQGQEQEKQLSSEFNSNSNVANFYKARQYQDANGQTRTVYENKIPSYKSTNYNSQNLTVDKKDTSNIVEVLSKTISNGSNSSKSSGLQRRSYGNNKSNTPGISSAIPSIFMRKMLENQQKQEQEASSNEVDSKKELKQLPIIPNRE